MSLSDLQVRLRDAAIGYVRMGWPILPVDIPTADRLICGRSPTDEATAHHWWSGEAYGIAASTGDVFDALEVPTRIGERMLPALAQYGTPAVIEVPLAGTWLFLVTPGSPRISDLPHGSGVRLHSKGRWVLLPPTPVIGGTVSWVGRPSGSSGAGTAGGCPTAGTAGGCPTAGTAGGRRLPHSMPAQWAALRALVSLRRQGDDLPTDPQPPAGAQLPAPPAGAQLPAPPAGAQLPAPPAGHACLRARLGATLGGSLGILG